MAVAAVPAPPTLAAERPRTAHARPLAVRRAHLPPTNRRRPPARFRGAPTWCTCRCTCSPWAHPHAHHSAHCLAAHVHARAAAAAPQQQQRRQQRQRRRRRRQRQRHQAQFTMIGSSSNQHLQPSSIRSGVMPILSACHQRSQKTRQVRIGLSSAPSTSRVSLHSRGSKKQIISRSCVSCCVSCWRHSCISLSRCGSLGQLHQPSWA